MLVETTMVTAVNSLFHVLKWTIPDKIGFMAYDAKQNGHYKNWYISLTIDKYAFLDKTRLPDFEQIGKECDFELFRQ